MSAPTIDELFSVMAHASCARTGVRIDLSPDLDPDDPMTRLAIALNVLLDDLEYRNEQAQASLRAHVDERTQRLRESEEAVRRREEFISIAAHELNTPLTSLQLALAGLRDGSIGTAPDQLRRAVELANRQARKLVVLVDTLLGVGRSQSGGSLSLHPEPTDLVALTRGVAELFGLEHRRRTAPLAIHAEAPVIGHWDKHRIEQVITNLVSNAIKFGDGKAIDVTITSREENARWVIVDHGIGIASDRLPKIFGRFERGVSAAHYGGLGLGLFIVEEIVHAHGGTVQAESVLGMGATFTLELPLARREDPATVQLPGTAVP